MMELIPIPCAVCNAEIEYRVVYPERIDFNGLNFAARRTPRRMHARIVECTRCGLIYSNPILPPEKIRELYRDSEFIEEAQLDYMCADYLAQLNKVALKLDRRESLLEIGCGNGCFLRLARGLFPSVVGVEPGRKAVEAAHPDIRDLIVNDFFHESMFEENSFDVVCIFQVLDHLLDPNEVLRAARTLIRPGGYLLSINHNVRSWITRILREYSPMFDIEHIYLFDTSTMRKFLENHDLRVEHIQGLANSYALGYAIKMFPFPGFAKPYLTKMAEWIGLGGTRIRLPAGNMVSIARKTVALGDSGP
jgi:2-polyprenyl-3-methyl-5-hydroxy-6-metoxy-1,4-benzoquinol methylase